MRSLAACPAALLLELAAAASLIACGVGEGMPPGTTPDGPPGVTPDGPPGVTPDGPPGVIPDGPPASAPPASWREHWFEHVQDVKLVHYDDDIAVYFDDDVTTAGTEWVLPMMGDIWRYTKQTYGEFGD